MRNQKILAGLMILSGAYLAACSNQETKDSAQTDSIYRGVAAAGDRASSAFFDPGPEKGSKWAELFGSTPNYRGIGDAVLGGSGEKFRWVFGPMWYRGRLQENEVKVFVVGQEGAQDENISNRAFTGSTGTKTQNFLNHLGIRYSYLFLNTFVYTINGQLADDPKFKWLEQGLDSPIVQYRHSLFDNMAATNPESLALIIGVGSGGKASVMTWLKANGAICRGYALDSCDNSAVEKKFKLKKKILAVGVPHPGGASPANGGADALKNIINGFNKASALVMERVKADSKWLPEDYMDISKKGGKARRGSTYKYANSSVPFWDFAFGTNWRMGKEGTTSNRQGADSIQVFSDDGKYNGKSTYAKLEEPKSFQGFTDSGKPIMEMKEGTADGGIRVGDLPYESPKYFSNEPERADMFDYGPCNAAVYTCELSQLLSDEWPDFKQLGVTQHESFGYGGIYRGRLEEAKVLILADQMDHDDFFSTRALTGDAGQKLQTFLYALGLTKSYAIIRTLPVDTLDLSDSARESVIMDPEVVKTRNKILKEVISASGTKVVISFGRFAQQALQAANLSGVSTYHLVESSDKDHVAQWNEVFNEVKGAVRGDVQALAKYSGKNSTINRHDLPAHTRWWMGTTGNRARRGKNGVDPNYYMVTAPKWVKSLKPIPAKVRVPSNLDAFTESEPSDAPVSE